MSRRTLLPLVLILNLIFAFLAACLSENYLKIKTSFPRYTTLKLNNYPVLILADFLIEQSPNGFDLNQELINQLEPDLRLKYQGRLIRKKVTWPEEKNLAEAGFWKSLLDHEEGGLALTGTASLKQEIRKTLGSRSYREIEGPFNLGKPSLEERMVSTLSVKFFLVHLESGEIAFQKEYKETRTVDNKRESVEVAFYELALLAKTKFLNQVLAAELPEERYLLLKDRSP